MVHPSEKLNVKLDITLSIDSKIDWNLYSQLIEDVKNYLLFYENHYSHLYQSGSLEIMMKNQHSESLSHVKYLVNKNNGRRIALRPLFCLIVYRFFLR